MWHIIFELVAFSTPTHVSTLRQVAHRGHERRVRAFVIFLKRNRTLLGASCSPAGPLEHGFESVVMRPEGGARHVCCECCDALEVAPRCAMCGTMYRSYSEEFVLKTHNNFTIKQPLKMWLTDRQASEAVQFIEAQEGRFFLNVWFHAPRATVPSF